MSVTSPLACDAGLAHRPRAAGGGPSPRAALALSILASSLAFVDGSVVNVALPALRHSLGAGAAELQWTINGYLLPLSALLLFGGALGDRYGRLRMLTLGVALFAAASAACAAAPDFPWLLAARACQGVGAALVLPNSLALLGAVFAGGARARAVGLWAAASAMSSAVGPVLGGWLIDLAGWRTIFLINLPLAGLALVIAVFRMREPPGEPQRQPLDIVGAVLGTAALGALAWALTLASGPGGWTPLASGLILAGVVLGAAFVRTEARKGDRAMAPPALFGSRSLVALNLMTFLLYGALGGFLVLLPYVLITAAGYGTTAAGAALLPFPLVMAAAGPVTGALAARWGARPLLVCGALLAGGGFALALRLGSQGDYLTQVLPCVLVVALGMACAAAPLTTAVLSAVDERHTGSASGLNSAVARAGGLAATAALGGVLSASGGALVAAFHQAALAGALAAAAAAASVVWGFRDSPRQDAMARARAMH
jgi:EmrB/QacA subfamily drug resistance transporter